MFLFWVRLRWPVHLGQITRELLVALSERLGAGAGAEHSSSARLKAAAGGGSARLLLSCEVTGAGLNQLFDLQTLDTHSHIRHILCEPQRGRN